jgi:formate hydrogenlyase subunit 3/multisubunit Na+/H+ antiporter MnhD subunit
MLQAMAPVAGAFASWLLWQAGWMHGVLVGAVFGMAVIAFMGAWRSLRNWRNSARRPARWVVGLQVALQVALGAVCVAFGLWFLLVGG